MKKMQGESPETIRYAEAEIDRLRAERDEARGELGPAQAEVDRLRAQRDRLIAIPRDLLNAASSVPMLWGTRAPIVAVQWIYDRMNEVVGGRNDDG